MEKDKILRILQAVTDPEIPVLTLQDLGVIREVHLNKGGEVEVVITPTYTGCPALDMMEVCIKSVLQEQGYQRVKVSTVLSPAWTTDWLSEAAKEKLKVYGIAPPIGSAGKYSLLGNDTKVECPQCGSMNTEMVSQFGSTACKALFQCRECLEPFDYFKCH
ncbi:MAG: phenylacetate-CoA oxygenase subunit PaaJ [Saprospiraceae bacterium]|nr:MAG: phenylacetate-CoA oxygenase subunit PaaJ [Saprospiraceae bacterium]